jgi:hypothetical protein
MPSRCIWIPDIYNPSTAYYSLELISSINMNPHFVNKIHAINTKLLELINTTHYPVSV